MVQGGSDSTGVQGGVSVAAKGLTYEVSKNRFGKKTVTQILRGVDFFVNPGHLCAIFGASGSGKSTLLNALAGRLQKANGKLGGEMLFNGTNQTGAIRRFSSYVMQHDLIMSSLTVEEVLNFCAQLRLKKATKEVRHERIEQVIRALSLNRCRKTHVGGEGRKGLSGGEMKRLAVAAELLDDSPVLFLDEPTTGLDSAIAAQVLKCLLRMAAQGKTIICTLHQPRSSIFSMFDHILLLNAGEVGACASIA
eukprot:GHVU01180318.1.p2 GENE.GHVU01180318.1~~GHVU01180318.1.p2  ORF type:complete len:250 (+),score=38.00 GHVU01180318.1:150-899(+)